MFTIAILFNGNTIYILRTIGKMDYEILFIILGIHINKSALDLYATPLKYRPKI